MPEAHSIEDRRLSLSISRLAEEFGMARETVAKRLATASVRPAATRNGYPVYRVRDAAVALLDSQAVDESGEIDPRKLGPQDRNAWYQSENRRIDLEMKAQQLIPAAQVEAEYAELVKSQMQFLDTLPDQLERDCALTPEQVESMHDAIDRARQGLYEKVTGDEPQALSA